MSVPTARLPIDDLRNRLTGRVITPDDEGYDDARKVLYDFADSRPAAVVRVANAADVARSSTSPERTAWSWPSGAAATVAPATGPPMAGSSSTCAT